IDRTTNRLTSMVNNLLDVTSLQMGRPLRLDRAPTDLVALAHQVASDLRPTTDRHQIRVESQVERLIGDWDSARIERVLSNLLSNSVKYSPKGGQITITVQSDSEASARWAVVGVRDEGIGIPADEVPHVFERFYRGRGLPESIEGTGLGLS